MSSPSTTIVIDIEGKRFTVDPDQYAQPVHLKNGVYEVAADGKKYSIRLVDFHLHSRECVVEVNGRTIHARILRQIDLKIESMGLNAQSSKKQDIVIAPMPGLVKSIKASPGDQVEKGTPLLILEAMKMENIITAPHAGKIKDILVEIGQAVEKGLPLAEFDPA